MIATVVLAMACAASLVVSAPLVFAQSTPCTAPIQQSLSSSESLSASVSAIIPSQSEAVAASLESAVTVLNQAITSLSAVAGCGTVSLSMPPAVEGAPPATTSGQTGIVGAPAVQVSVTPNPASPGQAVTFSWVSANAGVCTGSRGGTYGEYGSLNLTPPSLPYTYGMSCSGAGGVSPLETVTVTAATGSGAGAAVGASVPTLSGVQGYDPTTGAYSTSDIQPGQDLILWGNFLGANSQGAAQDSIMLNGFAFPTSTITYDSSNQINVKLASIAGCVLAVRVANANGVSAFPGLKLSVDTTICNETATSTISSGTPTSTLGGGATPPASGNSVGGEMSCVCDGDTGGELCIDSHGNQVDAGPNGSLCLDSQ